MESFVIYLVHGIQGTGLLNSRVLFSGVAQQLPHKPDRRPAKPHFASINWETTNTHLLAFFAEQHKSVEAKHCFLSTTGEPGITHT